MSLNPSQGGAYPNTTMSRTRAIFRDQDIVERDHHNNSEGSESSNELDLVDDSQGNKHLADDLDPDSEDLPPMAPTLVRQAAFINVATSSPFRPQPSLAA